MSRRRLTVVGILTFVGLIVASTFLWPTLTSQVTAQTTPEYRIPCNVTSNGNWGIVRNKKGLTDQQLLDDINNNGRFGHHASQAQIDFNNNPNYIGTYAYGVCNDQVLRAARSGVFLSFNNEGLGGWVLRTE